MKRSQLAKETVEIVKKGSYNAGAKSVSIVRQVRDCLKQTQYFSPEDLDQLLSDILSLSPRVQATTIEVQNETTLQGAKRLALSGQFEKVTALNFASAKNPGGGFLSGSQAQEESLARSSALYASLCKARPYYDYHRSNRSSLYSHRMILSPECPVIREDNGTLLEEPYCISFITSAAPNAAALIQKQEFEQMESIPTIFRERALRVLAIAQHHNTDALILGAWGCGVFRNDAEMVAQIFSKLIGPGGEFENRFQHILFSVLDKAPSQPTFTAFSQAFQTA